MALFQIGINGETVEAAFRGIGAALCELTAVEHGGSVGSGAFDGSQLHITIHAQDGNGAHQRLGVGMLGIVEDLLGSAVLDDGTVLEFKDLFGFAEKVKNRW